MYTCTVSQVYTHISFILNFGWKLTCFCSRNSNGCCYLKAGYYGYSTARTLCAYCEVHSAPIPSYTELASKQLPSRWLISSLSINSQSVSQTWHSSLYLSLSLSLSYDLTYLYINKSTCTHFFLMYTAHIRTYIHTRTSVRCKMFTSVYIIQCTCVYDNVIILLRLVFHYWMCGCAFLLLPFTNQNLGMADNCMYMYVYIY